MAVVWHDESQPLPGTGRCGTWSAQACSTMGLQSFSPGKRVKSRSEPSVYEGDLMGGSCFRTRQLRRGRGSRFAHSLRVTVGACRMDQFVKTPWLSPPKGDPSMRAVLELAAVRCLAFPALAGAPHRGLKDTR